MRRARAGEGPTLIEAMTYRQCGHSRSDPATYRPAGELEAWLARDPILIAERHLERQGAAREQLDRVREQARETVRAAAERALSWPEPAADRRLDDVWVNR